MRTIRLKLVILSLLFISAGSFAQTKKLSKTYSASGDVNLELDAKHTHIIIENWDKNEVQVDAYLEGDSKDKEAAKKVLDLWKVTTSRDGKTIKIESSGGGNLDMDLNMAELEGALAELPGMLEPIMNDLVEPILANIAENPLPPGFAEDMQGMKFDYEAYKKDGDKYLNRWEAEFEQKFGKDFEQKMEKWAEKMERNSAKWEEEYEMKMEAWGKDFEKDMEAWGEEFGKKMEAWGENFGKQFEAQMANADNKSLHLGNTSGLRKTIRIKVPQDTKLQLKVRHGELKLGNAKNLIANLSHSRLAAGNLAGKDTRVKVAYSPVKIDSWSYGVLETEFVKNCKIGKAVSLKLDSNSSNVTINELKKTGVLSGSFGKLDINKLGRDFETLTINLENSDLKMNIPDAAFNFSYNGVQSSIKHPGAFKLKSTKSYDNEILNGYHKSREASANITIKANYSDVLIN
ncbi:DUF4097 family beta strand repeat-containing protein [Christiangramia aquimixticola]|uniref:DUF4097 family beta strand repeat-containing protein n=1 Tax=Christiangramia aquimixticola TaxID=1697558 RepID=UPI003AA9B8A9